MSTTANQIIVQLERELAKADKPANRSNYQQFFKEKLAEPIGLRANVLRKISNETFKEIKGKPAKEVFTICDALLASGKRYMRYFAIDWAIKIQKDYRPQDFSRFERWLKKYVNNWGTCDHICTGPIGLLIRQYPKLAPRVFRWTRSKNRWLRRAAAVSLIMPVRSHLLLPDVFRTADAMLMDQDDMVQKGYGWMLKEASNVFPREVFDYVMKHKDRMPRTALRYAIEKLPAAKHKQAMKK